jgi:hypothetical protein
MRKKKTSLAHPKIRRIKTLPPDGTQIRMSFKEKTKAHPQRRTKKPLCDQRSTDKEKSTKNSHENSTLLSKAQPTSSLDQILKILEHVKMNGHKIKVQKT